MDHSVEPDAFGVTSTAAPRNAGRTLGSRRLVFGVAFLLGGLTLGCSEGRAPAARALDEAPSAEGEATASTAADAKRGSTEEADAPSTVAAPPKHPYDCTMPALPIPRPRACEEGKPYPLCKWHIPHAQHSRGTWLRWRNTIVEHMYGRPSLVSRVVTVAREFRAIYPEQPLLIGDLDAPGPRHVTHKDGVDVDFYLPGALLRDNAGGGCYESNYEGKSAETIESQRARVEELARILAACTDGKLRIYYNDEVVRDRFHRWFDERGYVTPFGRPMQRHNELHDFHFHVTIAHELEPLPSEPYADPPPIEPILDPPTEEEVAASDALSSRARPVDAMVPQTSDDKSLGPVKPDPEAPDVR